MRIAGADLHVVDIGTAKRGTIILVHGGRGIGDHAGELEAYRPLSDEYRLVAYDQRGCGESSETSPFTFDRLADDLEELRATLVGKPCVVLGGSFGGMIALTHAIRHHGSASHLILRGTAPSHHHEAEAIENIKARLHKATSASVEMVHKMFSDRVVDDTELMLIWAALQPLYFEKFDPDASLERTRTMRFHALTHNELFREKDYDLRPFLKDIAVPTLVVCGAADWICPPSQSRLIAEAVPKAELFMVENANHAVHVEARDAVLARVRTFLAANGA
ncbi:alpha/beta fold hydrolase [Falsiroseomonas sp. HW251]|uniref:alpha/beta fold hydrolase n=1 Tax=Falsiroseomonas sp. HW251 TaxID=3390998 RepID=UPI003D319506